jgi:hypothetical protein
MSSQKNTGFRKGLTTNNALYKFIDEILCALNDKIYVVRIFYDLTKAFYYMNYDI